VNIIRWLLGRVILLGELLFSPSFPQRSAEAQAALDRQTHDLALYQFQACPFCVKVRFAMKRLGLNIETRDARRVPIYREQLLNGGGQIKAPCLRIHETDGQVRWLYESTQIIHYLEQRFAVMA
jgi:glutaredoxin